MRLNKVVVETKNNSYDEKDEIYYSIFSGNGCYGMF